MTRINAYIDPVRLTDQHLIAELRELPRIFTAVRKRIQENKDFNDLPPRFVLGAGHVKFFYDKLYYLEMRHKQLRKEYAKRYNKDWQYKIDTTDIPEKLMQGILEDTLRIKKLLIDRISERIENSKQTPRYYGKMITKEEAIINLIN